MAIRRQNVYFGPNSVLKLKANGKLDTGKEFLRVMYALFADFLTGPYVLTHYETSRGNPLLTKGTENLLNGRVRVLHFLLNNRLGGKYKHLEQLISKISKILLKDKKKAKEIIEKFAEETNTLQEWTEIYNKILQKKRMGIIRW